MKIVISVSKEAKNRLGFGVTYTQDIQAICEAIGNSTSLNDVLDKIRTEIDRQEKWLLQAGYTAYNIDIAFDAIKSVVAESEDEE